MRNFEWIKPLLATLAGLTLVLTGLAACDNALQEVPDDFVSPENFYRNRADADAALNGAYQSLVGGYFGGLEGRDVILMLGNLSAQSTTNRAPGSARGSFDTYTFAPSNSYLFTWWAWGYDAINRANTVVERVPEIESMDPGVKDRYVAEARTLRSLEYFYLVRLFGRIPLRTSATSSLDSLATPARPASDLYEFIIRDLARAIPALPRRSEYATSVDRPRVSEGVARAYLAKAYLQRGGEGNPNVEPQPGDFQAAAEQLRQIIDSGEYRLLDDYGSLWYDPAVNESNDEVLFSVELETFEGTPIQNFLNPPESNWAGGQWTSMHGEVPFFQSYEDDDVRREATWITEFESSEGETITFDANDVKGDNYAMDGPVLNKLIIRNTNIGGTEGYRDYHLIRYADVLLMYAEALNEINGGPTGEAYDAINQVRNRAGLADLADGMDYEDFKTAVFHERRHELGTEGKGYLDGLRFWDRFEEVVEAQSGGIPEGYHTQPEIEIDLQDPKNRLLPIPQEALDRNPQLEQNEGW